MSNLTENQKLKEEIDRLNSELEKEKLYTFKKLAFGLIEHETYDEGTTHHPGDTIFKDQWIVELETRNKEFKQRIDSLNRENAKLYTKLQNPNRVIRDTIPGALRHETFKRDSYRCVECGATNKTAKLEVDHIIPLAQGGTDELNNLQTLCFDCNRSKKALNWKGGLE